MLLTGSAQMDAERAFARETRARRRASLARRLRRGRAGRLPVYDETKRRASGLPARLEIPLDAITGTVEPSRAVLFDGAFRPSKLARRRWERRVDGRAPRRGRYRRSAWCACATATPFATGTTACRWRGREAPSPSTPRSKPARARRASARRSRGSARSRCGRPAGGWTAPRSRCRRRGRSAGRRWRRAGRRPCRPRAGRCPPSRRPSPWRSCRSGPTSPRAGPR